MKMFTLILLIVVGIGCLLVQADVRSQPSRTTDSEARAEVLSSQPTPTPSPSAIVATPDDRPKVTPQISEIRPTNVGGRQSHNVDALQVEYDIDGRDIVAAIFDEGAVLSTHKEFRKDLGDQNSTRVRFRRPPGKPVNRHATHVAGTMAASGGHISRSKGMAPGLSTIYSEDWDNDLDKLEAMAPSIRISNHSYGPAAGWGKDQRDHAWIWWGNEQEDPLEDAKFGKYTDKEAKLDSIIYSSKKLLSFVAAGNDRQDGPEMHDIPLTQPISHRVYQGRDINGELVFKLVENETHKPDGWDRGGLDTISGLCVAKNAICVGAIGDSSSAAIMSESYSGWGPTDDGRVKPDVVANGQRVISTSVVANDPADIDGTYVELSGTSQASPTAAGVAALLLQLYRRERLEDPFASVLKALMIHTVTDPGEPGPDPVFGWGSIDALRAGRVIAQKLPDGRTFRHIIKYLAVSRNIPTSRLSLEPNGTNDPIKVTVVWTDPPGAANKEGLDDDSIVLENDLDVRLFAPDGTIYYPYSLDPANPLQRARKDGPNRRDNVEVLENAGSLAGEWTLEVNATTMRRGQQQDFAVVVSGLRER